MSSAEKLSGLENVLFGKKNGIAYVTVNRPKVTQRPEHGNHGRTSPLVPCNQDGFGFTSGDFHRRGEKAFIAGADIGELSRNDAVAAKELYASRPIGA